MNEKHTFETNSGDPKPLSPEVIEVQNQSLEHKTVEELKSQKAKVEALLAHRSGNTPDGLLLKEILEEMDGLIEEASNPKQSAPTEKSAQVASQPQTKEERLKRKKHEKQEKKRLNDIQKVLDGTLHDSEDKRYLSSLGGQRSALKNLLLWEGLNTRPELKEKLKERIRVISNILESKATQSTRKEEVAMWTEEDEKELREIEEELKRRGLSV